MEQQNPQGTQTNHIQEQIASAPNAIAQTKEPQSTIAIEDKAKQKLIIIDERYRQIIQKVLLEDEYESNFDQYMLKLNGDIIQQHCGIIKIRKLFGNCKLSQLPQTKLSQLLQILKPLCCRDDYPQLKLQSSWIIANILAGTAQRCKIVINKNFVGILINLLEDLRQEVVANAVWGLGNIAADSQENRFMLMNLRVVQKIASIVNRYQALKIKHGQLYYWSISNFCRNVPANLYQSTLLAIPIYAFAFRESLVKDTDTLCGCYWSLKYISEKRRGINMILKENMLPYLIQVIKKQQKPPLICPCIQIIGEISKGNQLQTDLIVTQQLLQVYLKKLYHPKKVIRQDIVWIISNITAGSQRQIELVINYQLLINRILQLFEFDRSSIIKEIGYIFANMTQFGGPSLIFSFFGRKQIVKRYVKAMKFLEENHISNMMDTLHTIFNFGERNLIDERNVFVDEAISCGIEEICDKMVYSTNEQIQLSLEKVFTSLRVQQMI